MNELDETVDQLANLMTEYRLAEGEISGLDWRVSFKRRSKNKLAASSANSTEEFADEEVETAHVEPVKEVQSGTPVTSPMNGIYYSSPSPSAPPFVREGEKVVAGQTIALIEAMKVFNEVPCPISGTVTKVVATNSQVVANGDVLLYIV